MRKEMRIEHYKDNILSGIFVGMILLISSLCSIRIIEDVALWEQTMRYIIPGILGYLVIGVVVMLIHRRERKVKTKPKNHYHNASGLYIMMIYVFFFEFSVMILPRTVGIILWVNIFVLFLLWLGEFYYLKRMAKKLNMVVGLVEETLIIELPDKPGGTDASFAFFETYCKKNNMQLEIMEKEIPGRVRLDGIEYSININMDYTMFGTCSYAIVLTTIVKK